MEEWDLPNWLTLCTELIVGIAIAIIVYKTTKNYEKQNQRTLSKMQNIEHDQSNLIKKMKIIIEKQNKIIQEQDKVEKKKRHSILLLIKNDFVFAKENLKYIKNKTFQRSNSFKFYGKESIENFSKINKRIEKYLDVNYVWMGIASLNLDEVIDQLEFYCNEWELVSKNPRYQSKCNLEIIDSSLEIIDQAIRNINKLKKEIV